MSNTQLNGRSNGGSLAVAIPAYNEADGIADFLVELDAALTRWAGDVTLVVVDDASTDDTGVAIKSVSDELHSRLLVHRNETNRGHGPTVATAYHLALGTGADYIFQVDGDGQFHGSDVLRVAEAVAHGMADVGVGARYSRQDPWFRKMLSAGLRLYLFAVFGVRRSDPNCPFRMYRSGDLRGFLAQMPHDPMVPTVYLTILERKTGVVIREFPVEHLNRRGTAVQGSTWGPKQRTLLVPRRLLRFVRLAFVESTRFARQNHRWRTADSSRVKGGR